MRSQIFFLLAPGLLASVDASMVHSSRRNNGSTISLVAGGFGTTFDAPMEIGGQTFKMLVDTGSSDTYVMRDGYTCIESGGNGIVPQKDCLYANKTYHDSPTYRKIPDEMFGIKYGAGLASGEMAYEDVTIGGLTAHKQKVAIANVSNPMGSKLDSGLLGLGYPSLTSAHPANHSSNQTYWYDRLPYSPLMYTMQKQGLMDPYFSLALARTPQNATSGFGGYMTIGGLPPRRVPYSSEFTSVPVELLDNLPKNFTSGKRTRAYWATTISSVKYGSSSDDLTTNSTSFQVFLDSGNYVQYLPSAIVEPVNAMFDPPAKYDEDLGLYVVDCSAKAPEFGFTIGNQTFFHNGKDMIYQTGEVCVSNLASAEEVSLGPGLTFNIIGVPFLKNVVAVFDFGKNEMRFSKRLDSNSTSTSTGSAASGSSIPAFSLGFKSLPSVSWIGTLMVLIVSANLLV